MIFRCLFEKSLNQRRESCRDLGNHFVQLLNFRAEEMQTKRGQVIYQPLGVLLFREVFSGYYSASYHIATLIPLTPPPSPLPWIV